MVGCLGPGGYIRCELGWCGLQVIGRVPRYVIVPLHHFRSSNSHSLFPVDYSVSILVFSDLYSVTGRPNWPDFPFLYPSYYRLIFPSLTHLGFLLLPPDLIALGGSISLLGIRGI